MGGWNDHGVDPKAYSNKICALVAENVRQHETKFEKQIEMSERILQSIIVKSVKENKEMGSSTLLVLYLDQAKNKNELYTAYLGDSSYLIARPTGVGNFKLLAKAEEQCHSFNFPFQVGTNGDDPSKAITHKHHVQQYDLVIAASDGLWDNLEVEEVLQEINKLSKENNSISLNTESLSQSISKKAEFVSYDKRYLSPFAKKARENKYKNFIGGKPDDITVVAAQILHRPYEDEKLVSLHTSKSEEFDNKSDHSSSTNNSLDLEDTANSSLDLNDSQTSRMS